MENASTATWHHSAPLFLQCVLQSRSKSVDLSALIGTGDYLNHAVFEWEEFSESLEQLLAAAYLQINGAKIEIGSAFESDYQALGKAPKSVNKEYEQLKKLLLQKELVLFTPQAPFTRIEFEAAVNTYLKR